MSAMESLLGVELEPQCKRIADDIAVHWWSADAPPGTLCLCGESTRAVESEIEP